ncbi:3-dehydroquinate synthase [Galdieria sulphuraria]|nr:3-dehydroquinate synthase [Galdieria sulphuraria]
MEQPKCSCFITQHFLPKKRFLSGSSKDRRLTSTLWQQKKKDIQSTPVMNNLEKLLVQTPSKQYPIYFGSRILDSEEYFTPHIPGDKVLIVTNNVVGPLYLERLTRTLESANKKVYFIEIPNGEIHKNLTTLSIIYDKCMENRLDRKSTLIALGGGVVGDLAGFAAATFVRGIPFIQVPTTLLAVVDSAVGGKTGVNHPKGKNMIGAFYQPQAVVVDINTLSTLDDRQLAAGLAEVIKYGLIRDIEFLEWCEGNMKRLMKRDPEALSYAMYRSCENKSNVVSADERESGIRAILNLGHTFGHAIEAGTGFSSWLHGEAVAAGIVMAAEMSYRMGWLTKEDVVRVETILAQASLPIRPPPTMTLEKFMTFMSIDKKVESGKLKLVLLRGIGNAIVTGDFPIDVLQDTILHFQKLVLKHPEQYEVPLASQSL